MLRLLMVRERDIRANGPKQTQVASLLSLILSTPYVVHNYFLIKAEVLVAPKLLRLQLHGLATFCRIYFHTKLH